MSQDRPEWLVDPLLSANEGDQWPQTSSEIAGHGKALDPSAICWGTASCTRLGVRVFCDPPRAQKREADEVATRLDEASESELECEDTSCPAVLVGVAYGEITRPISAACLDEAMLSRPLLGRRIAERLAAAAQRREHLESHSLRSPRSGLLSRSVRANMFPSCMRPRCMLSSFLFSSWMQQFICDVHR